MKMLQLNRMSLVGVSLALFASASLYAEGGRVGVGGGGRCESVFPSLAPRISQVDPQAAKKSGCKIPTGEVKFEPSAYEQSFPSPIADKLNESWEIRIDSTPDCTHLVRWSFEKNRENQSKLHRQPKKCDYYHPSGTGNASADYYCEKIPFFTDRDAAIKAKAKIPFAYADAGMLVVSDESCYITIFDQKSVDGKVKAKMAGTTTSWTNGTQEKSQSVSPYPALDGMSGVPRQAASEAREKSQSVSPYSTLGGMSSGGFLGIPASNPKNDSAK